MARIFGVISGFASILGLGMSIALTYMALTSDIKTEFREIIVILSISTTILLLSVVFLFVYYFREVDKLSTLPRENLALKLNLKRNEILVKNTSEYYHNVAHYYRNLILQVEEVIKTPDDEKLKHTLELFDKFLNTFTSNMHSFITLFSGDNCAVTVKITKYDSDGRCLIKTFYRDPISYRKRKRSDYLPNAEMKVYDVEDNTAFKVISNPMWKNTTYLCDDLKEKWKKGEYENKTYGWMNLYNATAVIPIAKRIDQENKKILGFLCVDNFAGNLANATVENFLSSMADILYPLFEKFETVAIISNERGIFNERAKAFTNWNYR